MDTWNISKVPVDRREAAIQKVKDDAALAEVPDFTFKEIDPKYDLTLSKAISCISTRRGFHQP